MFRVYFSSMRGWPNLTVAYLHRRAFGKALRTLNLRLAADPPVYCLRINGRAIPRPKAILSISDHWFVPKEASPSPPRRMPSRLRDRAAPRPAARI